jgi:hypothetical protein
MRNFAKKLETRKSEVSKEMPDKWFFRTLNIIDPTLLSEHEKLLEYIGTAMYKGFKDHYHCYSNCSKNNNLNQDDVVKELIKAFSELHKYLVSLRKPKEGIDNPYFEGSAKAFETIAASAELKKAFSNLTEKYIEYFKKKEESNKNRQGCLVIQIDDMDLLTRNIFEFSEEIKKFMMVKNVLILINFDLDRFSQNLLTHYLHHDKKLTIYSSAANYPDLRKRTRDLLSVVSKYMDKLFPMDHRVLLPTPATSPEDCKYKYIELIDKKEKHENCCNDAPKEVTRLEADSLEKFIFCPLFEFIRIRYPFNGQARFYLPGNLRELHNFVKSLYQATKGTHFIQSEQSEQSEGG